MFSFLHKKEPKKSATVMYNAQAAKTLSEKKQELEEQNQRELIADTINEAIMDGGKTSISVFRDYYGGNYKYNAFLRNKEWLESKGYVFKQKDVGYITVSWGEEK